MIGMIGEGGTVEERFKVARDCGFEGVEVDWPPGRDGPGLDELRTAAEKSGLVIHGVVNSRHWAWHLNNPAEEVRRRGAGALLECIDAAAALKASSVLLVPGVVNKEMGYAECYRLSQGAVAEAMARAREKGVTIAVENVWNNFLMSPLEAARYVDELRGMEKGAVPEGKPPAVAFHFDIGNVVNFGWPADWVRTLGARIVKLHVKDFSRGKRDKEGLWKGFDVEVGDGDAEWAMTMAALDEVGYSTDPVGRWATAEVRGGDAARLREVSERMTRVFGM
jgi:hexulose-6-phosphate isomerase